MTIHQALSKSSKRFFLNALIVLMAVTLILPPTASCRSNHPNVELSTIYVLYASYKGDRSYSDSVYAGLFRAQEEDDFLKEEYTPDEIAELDAMFSSASFGDRSKPDLVIVVGYTYEEYSEKWAKLNPDIDFLLIDHRKPDLPNARTLELCTFGGSYLAGILAAKVTKTDKIGVILGTKTWVLEDFQAGFEKGAKSQNRDIELEVRLISNEPSGFANPEEGKRIANEMYESGCDIIYAVAGASGLGIIEAAKSEGNRFVIGVDWDQTYLGPNVVIASVVKNLDTLVYQVITNYLQGMFQPGVLRIGLQEGATGIVFNPKFSGFESEVMQFYPQALAEEAKLTVS